MKRKRELIADEIIRQKIFIIRGKKVMLDRDLAEFYGVPTKRLNEQVKRNVDRFPEDFLFQLTEDEFENLRSQCATTKPDTKTTTRNDKSRKWSQCATTSQQHRSVLYLPYAFTEHGVAMLSAVLKSEQATHMSIFIIRAFIKMRESLDNYRELALKVNEIETKQNQDHALLANIHSVVKHLIEKPSGTKKNIGFSTE